MRTDLNGADVYGTIKEIVPNVNLRMGFEDLAGYIDAFFLGVSLYVFIMKTLRSFWI